MVSLGRLLMENIPVLVMLLVGVGLLVFEMYVPGFGAPGISGIVLLAILAAILCVALVVFLILASRGRLARSKLVLNDVAVPAKAAGENDLDRYAGCEGVTHTALRPAGIGVFDGTKLNVVSDGEFIAKDRPIRVQSVDGNRIVVCEITEG